ncbi:hypothetical protein C8J57DRAFT_1726060 [Mycena rebaudengoi]|nr:hypothetical protein C8J57DRAFT_1726060 [Mycena rebaudengoi]
MAYKNSGLAGWMNLSDFGYFTNVEVLVIELMQARRKHLLGVVACDYGKTTIFLMQIEMTCAFAPSFTESLTAFPGLRGKGCAAIGRHTSAQVDAQIRPQLLHFTPVDKGMGRATGDDVFVQPSIQQENRSSDEPDTFGVFNLTGPQLPRPPTPAEPELQSFDWDPMSTAALQRTLFGTQNAIDTARQPESIHANLPARGNAAAAQIPM